MAIIFYLWNASVDPRMVCGLDTYRYISHTYIKLDIKIPVTVRYNFESVAPMYNHMFVSQF